MGNEVTEAVLSGWIRQIKFEDGQDVVTIDDRQLLSALEELQRLRSLFSLADGARSGKEL